MELYFLARWLTVAIIRSFFAEVTVMGLHRIPMYGPVIFVGNHNNQFVDASMLLAILPRTIRFLIAEVSLSRRVVGPMAKQAGAIAVKRPQDKIFKGCGGITGWQPFTAWFENQANKEKYAAQREPQEESSAGSKSCCKGVLLGNEYTKFTLDFKTQDKVKILDINLSLTITDVVDDRTVCFAEECPLRPTLNKTYEFEVVPKVDQTGTYGAITEALHDGQTIGIFPEGGSHDRPDLLPLKPGVAIMALNAASTGVEDVLIIPVGIHYFNPEKFASRASVDIGVPLPVPPDLVDMFQGGQRKEAVELLMAKVKNALTDCIVSAPDLETVQCIKLCATLYPPERIQTSREVEHHLYHLFSRLYRLFRSHPSTIKLNRALFDYQTRLAASGIPDSEVWELKQSAEQGFASIIKKSGILAFHCVIGLLPIPLWGPLRLTASWMAERHRRGALEKSSVKIKATDVIASYKILCLLGLFPLWNLLCGCLAGSLFARSKLSFFAWLLAAVCLLPPLFYYSMRSAEKIIPMMRQIRALGRVVVGEINVWHESERELVSARIKMQLLVRKFLEHVLSFADEDDGVVYAHSMMTASDVSFADPLIESQLSAIVSAPAVSDAITHRATLGLRHAKSEWDLRRVSGEKSKSPASQSIVVGAGGGVAECPTPVLGKEASTPTTTGSSSLLQQSTSGLSRGGGGGDRGGDRGGGSPLLNGSGRARLREIREEFERLVPLVVMQADTRRLQRLQANYGPSVIRSFLESREEIL